MRVGANTPRHDAFSTEVVPVDLRREWNFFDKFGPLLRAFLQDAPIDLRCEEVADVIALFEPDWGRRVAEDLAMEMYRHEIKDWVRDYRSSFDTPPPAATGRNVISPTREGSIRRCAP